MNMRGPIKETATIRGYQISQTGVVVEIAGELALVPSLCKRVSAAVMAVTSVSLLAACELSPPGALSAATAETNPATPLIHARGWQMPRQTGIEPGPISVRGAHDVVAIAPHDDEIETADIAPPSKQGGDLSGNPSADASRDPLETADTLVPSKTK